MCGRMAVNLFGNEIGTKYITDDKRVDFFINGAVSLINEPYPYLIQAGCCLLQNICIVLSSSKDSKELLNEIGVSALSQSVKKEYNRLKASETSGPVPQSDTLIMLLKVLGVLLNNNDIGIAIFSTLPEETGIVNEITEISKHSGWTDASAIAKEICSILGL